LDEARLSFIDFILPLVRHRKLIAGLVGAAAVAAVAAAFVMPKSWRASVTLLPPERRMDNPLFLPGGVDVGASLRGISLRHVATPTDIFVAILKSRNVRQALVERLGLAEEYGVGAIGALRSKTDIRVSPDGIIVVRVVASSPEKAAEVANGYVDELDRVNRNLALKEAAAVRQFVERELEQAKTRLASAEETLREFQERHGAIEVTEQARAIISAAATLRAQIVAAEVELGVLRRTHDAAHPDVVAARDYVNELKLRLAEIEGEKDPAIVRVSREADGEASGRASGAGPADSNEENPQASGEIFPPLSRMPALGLEFGRLLRDVKTEEAVMALLTEQYHRARIEERRSLPTVRVLDPAFPPERTFRPRRFFMVALAAGVSLFLSILLAYGLDIVERIRNDPERYSGVHGVIQDLRKGLRR
jgi:uncharacterized protein involved in exopolysaccharide biosynthesis